MKKTYIIGDVHGCYHTLLDLLNRLPKDARIIMIGDLVDRGPYTKEVIDLVIKNNYECVLGNHEDFMIRHIENYFNAIPNRWYDNDQIGGKQTIDSYKGDIKTLKNHVEYLKTLPRYILIDKFFITHGLGLPYFNRKDEDDRDIQDGLIKARIEDETSKWGKDWEKNWREYDLINIFGHTIYEEVKIGENYYGIDTGCQSGGKLTAIEIPTMNIVDVALNKKDI